MDCSTCIYHSSQTMNKLQIMSIRFPVYIQQTSLHSTSEPDHPKSEWLVVMDPSHYAPVKRKIMERSGVPARKVNKKEIDSVVH